MAKIDTQKGASTQKVRVSNFARYESALVLSAGMGYSARMGKAKAPQQSSSQKEAEALQIELMQKQLESIEDAKPLKIPRVKPALPLPPPPMQTGNDLAQAEQEARRKALTRTNTARGTLFAGNTGGFKPAGSTLLG